LEDASRGLLILNSAYAWRSWAIRRISQIWLRNYWGKHWRIKEVLTAFMHLLNT